LIHFYKSFQMSQGMDWFQGGVGEAIAEAKVKGSVFVVVVKGQPDDEATKALESILEDNEVSGKFGDMVCIEVVNGSPTCAQFAAIYPVILVPSVFFIDSRTGVDLEITGGVITKQQLIDSIEKVRIKMSESNSSNGVNISTLNAAESVEETKSEESKLPGEQKVESSSCQEDIEEVNRSTSETSEIRSSDVSNQSNSLSLEERVERAKRMALQKQLEREKEAEDKEKNAELERRKLGKEMAEMKSKKEEQELKEAALNRRKDKEEEKKAREAVKAAIEQDRLARKMKYDADKKAEDEHKKEVERENLAKAAAAAEISAAERASIARIQFRLPDGRSQTKQFPSDSPLSEVYNFVESELSDRSQVSLSTTFPRRQLDIEDKTRSLKELQMAPSATILVIPAGGLVSSSDGGFMSLVWLLLTPFTFLWAMLSNLFSGSSNTSPRPVSQDRSRIGRIRNPQDDKDDDNNTWNGNSTQQQ